jgi:hypothetical protein
VIRIGKVQFSYRGVDRSPARALSLTRHALATLAKAATPEGGRIGRLQVEVRVKRDMADAAIADRIADTLVRRL